MRKNIIFLTIFSVILLSPFIAKGAVVINEVLYDPDGTDAGLEYITLYNNGDSSYSLTNHCLYASTEHYIFGSFSLGAKEGVIIHWNAEGSNTTTDLYTGKTNWSNMGNSSGSVALFLNHTEHESSIIDFIRYHAVGSTENKTWESAAIKAEIWTAGDFIPDVNEGKSIKLKTDGVDNNSSSDWMEATLTLPQEEDDGSSQQQSTTQQQATPTTTNQPPIANAGNDIIAFIGDEITFDGSKSYDPDGSELAYEWNLGEGGVKNEAVATYQYSYPGTYLVTLRVYDGFYYSNDTITVQIYPKKITINEFLPNPVGKDAGDEEDFGEWVELYNDSDQIVNISGWQLDDEDGGSKPFVFPENTLIAPKGFLVFSRQATNIALNNDTDKVRLLLSTGVVFQEVSYEKAKEGLSSALTPQGFVWSAPTPGLPNIVISETQAPEYEGSLQSETTGQSSGNVALNYNSQDSVKGGWVYSTRPEAPVEKDLSGQEYYNLADLEKSAGSSSKPILIILTIVVVISAIVVGILKLKNSKA